MKRSVVILSILVLALLVAAPVAALQPSRLTLVWPAESPFEYGPLTWCSATHSINARFVGTRDITRHWPSPYIDELHPKFVEYKTNVVITVYPADYDPATGKFTPRNSNTMSSNLNIRGEQHFPDPSNNLISEWVFMEGSGLNVIVPGYGKVHVAGRLFMSSDYQMKSSGNPLPVSPEDTQALCDCLG